MCFDRLHDPVDVVQEDVGQDPVLYTNVKSFSTNHLTTLPGQTLRKTPIIQVHDIEFPTVFFHIGLGFGSFPCYIVHICFHFSPCPRTGYYKFPYLALSLGLRRPAERLSY